MQDGPGDGQGRVSGEVDVDVEGQGGEWDRETRTVRGHTIEEGLVRLQLDRRPADGHGA